MSASHNCMEIPWSLQHEFILFHFSSSSWFPDLPNPPTPLFLSLIPNSSVPHSPSSSLLFLPPLIPPLLSTHLSPTYKDFSSVDSVYQQHSPHTANNMESLQREWFVFEHQLVLPEYIIHFQYSSAVRALPICTTSRQQKSGWSLGVGY